MKRSPLRFRDGEGGATAVIIVLSLFAMFGLLVLTVDVGQLLFRRRAMVNASDAAALAAAQSCASLADTSVPATVANVFAQQNVSVAAGGITDIVGCDGPPFGHVTVQYGMDQSFFFGGVLGATGNARVSTEATAGWGPAGAAHPMPIVVYEGTGQGGCDIRENIPPGEPCYMWYDNDLFANSSFGFLNLCTAQDPCQQGWDVGAADSCPNVGSSQRDDWINGTWNGQATETNYPATTYVCRVSGLSSSDWAELSARVGSTPHVPGVEDPHDLLFPVNDCATQVDRSGVVIGCNATVAPDKYNIIGFIVLHLEAVYDSAAEWGGTPLTHCTKNNFDVAQNVTYPVSAVTGGGCPSPSTPSGVQNFRIDGNSSGPWTYDAVNKQFTWRGPDRRVQLDFDWWINGQCGPPPANSSAVCIKTTTVEARFRGGSICESCKDFGVRAVRLCDLDIGSCPRDRN